nr:hypothetical protein [Bradyrhizobium sp. IC3069]
MLSRHEPFPAIVTDRRWNVMQANRAAARLMTMLLGPLRMQRPLNHMRMFLAADDSSLSSRTGRLSQPRCWRGRGMRRWPRRSMRPCNRPGAN